MPCSVSLHEGSSVASGEEVGWVSGKAAPPGGLESK